MSNIGVLALQGDFLEHILVLRHLGVDPVEVRKPEQLEALAGLIIPGGESTTMANLMDAFELRGAIQQRARQAMAIWGSCAGMILLAKHLVDERPMPLGLMAMTVSRNAYGRQLESFETDLDIPALQGKPFHAVFIRAPKFVGLGKNVEIVAELPNGEAVAARQGKLLATSFHPELTNDFRFHQYFLEIVHGTV
ncbi:MAG: pyridoxal 5'-phosphate synthase glutaminase subunit PdxT [Dehalococcoidia bacterium]|nr:pyridoxal 5'-phosphate synthase glutaminase subunit PdxT [Dehalococcoidia bacterium]